MWDLPGSGLEPVFPGLAGGFLTTAPPGKSTNGFLNPAMASPLTLLQPHWLSHYSLTCYAHSCLGGPGGLFPLLGQLFPQIFPWSTPSPLSSLRWNVTSQGDLSWPPHFKPRATQHTPNPPYLALLLFPSTIMAWFTYSCWLFIFCLLLTRI